MKTTECLVVVDMLNDFIDKNGALYCGQSSREIIDKIISRIKAYAEDKKVIIFLCDSHSPDDLEFLRFPKHCVEGSLGAEIIEKIKAVFDNLSDTEYYVVTKTRFSGFYNTDLEAILGLHDITSCEVVGVCTSICVMDTVGEFSNRGMYIQIPKNCVADFDPEMHKFALTRMENIYGVTLF